MIFRKLDWQQKPSAVEATAVQWWIDTGDWRASVFTDGLVYLHITGVPHIIELLYDDVVSAMIDVERAFE